MSRKWAQIGCYRQESGGTATRPLGFCIFSLDGHCRIFEPHQASKALPTQEGPSAHCEGKEKSTATPAKRSGADYQLIFFSNI